MLLKILVFVFQKKQKKRCKSTHYLNIIAFIADFVRQQALIKVFTLRSQALRYD